MRIIHWFLPHKKNNFHPIALRSTGIALFALLFIAIPPVYNITSAHEFRVLGYATNINITDLHNLSNQERINAGVSPLILNSALNNAAQAKALDMMTDDYWAHVAPDSTTPWYFITANGYSYSAAGENLAKDFNLSSGVVAGWMASQLHKDNVLNTTYQDVGYAVLNGVLLGSETTLVVAMYGATLPTVAPQPITQTQPSPPPSSSNTAQPKSTTPTTTENTVIDNSDLSTAEPKAEPIVTLPTIQKTTNEITIPASNINTGNVEGLSTYLSLKTYNALNWGQKASILLLSTLILLFLLKHTMIWRERKRYLKHIWLRSHPIGQSAMLLAVMVITILSGAGVVL